VTEGAKELMRRMLKKDPSERIELLDLIDFPYCLIEDEELENQIQKEREKIE